MGLASGPTARVQKSIFCGYGENWQTRMIQVHVSKDLQVQALLPAPNPFLFLTEGGAEV